VPAAEFACDQCVTITLDKMRSMQILSAIKFLSKALTSSTQAFKLFPKSLSPSVSHKASSCGDAWPKASVQGAITAV
jgi:hypothetical protein